MSRKDSRGMFANVLGGLDQPAPSVAPVAGRTPSPHLMKVAAGVRQIQEKGEALDQLLKDGDHIIEVDPSDVAPSAIPDRFEGAYEGSAIEAIKESIQERGQIVPGLVRPLKDGSKPYQIVFGRRRLAAAAALGIKFRAILRELPDEEAIVRQGEENTNRNDLSFIEKCVFALAQEEAGYRRDTICASLSTKKSHLSEMLKIASAIPRAILFAIGPAPEVGRRRWLAFAETFAIRQDAAERVSVRLADHSQPDTNLRFQVASMALQDKAPVANETEAAPSEIKANGFVLATVSYPSSGPRISFTKAVPAEFVDFLNNRMEALHSEFVRSTQPKQ
jgi:ParB family chromosome partitioning protein